MSTMTIECEKTFGEKVANAVSHGFGALPVSGALPVLASRALWRGPTTDVVAAGVFAGSMVLLYGVSSLYHAVPASRAEALLQRLDHAAIYVSIAGSYMPFTLDVLRGRSGWTLFVVWFMAAFGVAIRLLDRLKHRLISTGLYFAPGWVVVVAARRLAARLPGSAVALLVAGALSYTLGTVVLLFDDRIRYSHLVWHLFVLVGCACHFLGAFWFANA